MRILFPLLFLTLFVQGQNDYFNVSGGTTFASLGGFVVDDENASFIVNYYTLSGDYEKPIGNHVAFNLGLEINTSFGRYKTLWASIGGGIKAFKEYNKGLYFHFNLDYGSGLRLYDPNAEKAIATAGFGLGYSVGSLSISAGIGQIFLGGWATARFKVDNSSTYDTHIGEYILPIKVSYSIPFEQ